MKEGKKERRTKEGKKNSVHKHTRQERGEYCTILTEQAWLIKDLLFKKNEFTVNSGVRVTSNPERARQLHLDRAGSQSRRRIASSCQRALPAV